MSEGSSHDWLRNPRALLLLALWYIFSGCSLIMNKHILSYMGIDPIISSMGQVFMSLVVGLALNKFSFGLFHGKQIQSEQTPTFYKNMFYLGFLRFATLATGTLSLKYIAASFIETIKGSAPFFTVYISQLLTGEHTSLMVQMTLLPIVGGLLLCSATELSFNIIGWSAGIATTVSECCQNVFSKILISGEKYHYTPLELQIFSSLLSYLVQIPVAFLYLDYSTWSQLCSSHTFFSILLNGLFFSCQSIVELALLDYISPVTHSIANALKRALLIWVSVLYFGNEISFLSGLGTTIVILGVFGYIKVKQKTESERKVLPTQASVL